jgi:hypothetical protein
VRSGAHHSVNSFGVIVRDEAKAAGPAGGAVHHDDGIDNAAEQPEDLLEIRTLHKRIKK